MSASVSRAPRILLVVDAAELTAMLAAYLSNAGLEVAARGSLAAGEVALRDVAKRGAAFELAVLDLMLPAEVEASGAPGQLLGDARSLRQLVRNLVANAQRHAAGAELWVRAEPLDAAHPERGARIVVEDAGPGVAKADRARIFEPFARGERASTEGAGLGLAIARQVARHHGGDLTYEPRAAGGSRFVAALPGRPPESPEGPAF